MAWEEEIMAPVTAKEESIKEIGSAKGSLQQGVINTELCGEGLREIRGVINCRGFGLKFRSGADFGEHGLEVQRRVRQEWRSRPPLATATTMAWRSP